MKELNGQPRFLCSHLVTLSWSDSSGQNARVVANLEEIWTSGLCLEVERPVEPNTPLRIVCDQDTEYQGVVQKCFFRFTGFFVEVRFKPGYRWSRSKFLPKHFFDVRALLPKQKIDQLKALQSAEAEEKCAYV